MSDNNNKFPVSLPTGKIIWLTLDQYLNIDYQYLVSHDLGEWVDDPFKESALVGERRVTDDEFYQDLPDLDIEIDLDMGDE